MRIGLYQSHIIWEEKHSNITKLEEVLEGQAKGLDLLLLPEMSFTGFSMNTEVIGEENETCEIIRDNTAIGFGWVKYRNNSENHYSVIDKNGIIVLDYVKIHPFSYAGEDKYFRSGMRLSFFVMQDLCFSTLICYDLRFPEVFRLAANKSTVIIVPANWPESRREHWECLLRAREIENQVYVLGINCVGKINGQYYSGDSCVISPNGKILTKITGTEGVISVQLIDDVSMFRERFPSYRDRKDQLYQELRRALSRDLWI